MNWYKIIGYSLIAMAIYEMGKIIADYVSGKLTFWPFGADVGAALIILLGIFLIRRGNRKTIG